MRVERELEKVNEEIREGKQIWCGQRWMWITCLEMRMSVDVDVDVDLRDGVHVFSLMLCRCLASSHYHVNPALRRHSLALSILLRYWQGRLELHTHTHYPSLAEPSLRLTLTKLESQSGVQHPYYAVQPPFWCSSHGHQTSDKGEDEPLSHLDDVLRYEEDERS